jgi:hypothetical protein
MPAKCAIIPSIAVSMLVTETVTITFSRETWDSFINTLRSCEKVVNYVRHKPTTDLIESAVGKMETGFEFKIEPGTLMFIVGLKFRTPVSGADVKVTPEELLIYRATIL